MVLLLFLAIAIEIPVLNLIPSGNTVRSSTVISADDNFPASNSTNCTPPDWAVAIGHGDLWKLHNGCK
jgi:hypothetical protein